MSGLLEDTRTLLGAASASAAPEFRIVYAARARLLLAEALDELKRLQSHLAAIEQELARTAVAQ